MHRPSSSSVSFNAAIALAAGILCALCSINGSRALAQDAAEPVPTAPRSGAPTHTKKAVPPKPVRPAAAAAAPASPPATAAPPAPAAPAANPANAGVSQKLVEAGAGCTGRVDAIARDSLAGTKTLLPVSGFNRAEPGKHMVSVVIGQSFGPDAKVPYGLTGIVAAPGAGGSRCDGYRFQVMPSPLACKDIQADILKGGSVVADLAGFPLLQNASGQIALMPAAGGNGCVVVNVRTDY